jgi:uncharacterized protein (DUF433 family)
LAVGRVLLLRWRVESEGRRSFGSIRWQEIVASFRYRLGPDNHPGHCLGVEIDIMSTASQYPHLTIDDDVTARIERTRYKVIHLAGEHYHYGWSAEEILRQHPDLRPEQVHAALTNFHDHQDQFVEQMRACAEAAEAGRLEQTLSRALLLGRRSWETR